MITHIGVVYVLFLKTQHYLTYEETDWFLDFRCSMVQI